MSLEPRDVLLVGLGATAVCYYRMLLPAQELDCDYVGLYGEPPDAHYATGLVGGGTKMPAFTDYKLVVLQQPKVLGWLEIIRALQRRGTVVALEVDDWLHSVQHRPDHAFRDSSCSIRRTCPTRATPRTTSVKVTSKKGAGPVKLSADERGQTRHGRHGDEQGRDVPGVRLL